MNRKEGHWYLDFEGSYGGISHGRIIDSFESKPSLRDLKSSLPKRYEMYAEELLDKGLVPIIIGNLTLKMHIPKRRTVVMPERLTAEEGFKAALSGEYYEEVEIPNPLYEEGESEPEFYTQRVPISWTTIKDIYRDAVEFERNRTKD